MKKNKIFLFVVIAASLFIGCYVYSYLINRISIMFLKNEIIPFYDDVNLDKNYQSIANIFNFENIWNHIKVLFHTIISFFSSDFLIIIVVSIEIILFIYIIFMLWICRANYSYKTTFLAKALIHIVEFIKKNVKDFMLFFSNNRFRLVLIILFLSGILITLFFELFIFIIMLFTSNPIIMMFSMFKWLVVKLVDFILNGSLILKVMLFIIMYVFLAFHFASKRGRINWARFKRLVADGATVNIIDGEPGAGKTLTIVQAGLASTENMFDLLQKNIIEFEITHPDFNFAKVRLLFKIFFMSFEENEVKNIFKTAPNILYDLFELHNYINTDLCRMMFNMHYRGTSVISASPMIDPYDDSLTRKVDVQSMRFFQKLSSMPYEPDITIVYPEMDKEFNSHDSKGEVSDDGTFAFFALFSHICDRAGGFWGDAQDRDQIIKRIRGVAGKNFHLNRKKVKLPFMLNLIYKPLLMVYNKLLKVIVMYLGKRDKTEKKWTYRHKAIRYKRNNLSFMYQLLKYIAGAFNYVIGYIEKYEYFKIYAEVSTKDDLSNAHEITYCLNIMDLDHNGEAIYDSTYFRKFYEQLREILTTKNGIKQNVMMLEKWKSMDPDIFDYASTSQRILSKIVEGQFKDK